MGGNIAGVGEGDGDKDGAISCGGWMLRWVDIFRARPIQIGMRKAIRKTNNFFICFYFMPPLTQGQI